jgi:hypothetical protein
MVKSEHVSMLFSWLLRRRIHSLVVLSSDMHLRNSHSRSVRRKSLLLVLWRVRAPAMTCQQHNIQAMAKFTSSTTTAAPSPMTNPARSLSNGLEDRWGLSLKTVARLRDLANPPIARGWIQDSAPPAIMTSASPKAMKRDASPSEWAPVVQAVVTA